MKKLIDRYSDSLRQFIKFGVVGGSGVFVNLAVFVFASWLASLVWETNHGDAIMLPIPFTSFNVRWYHLFSLLAFVVANLVNFQLNRSWTFKSSKYASWWGEYWPFMVVGSLAQGIGMIIETLLQNPRSPIYLPAPLFDTTSGLHSRALWAHLIMIAVTVPVSFLLNKFWTFRSIRRVEAVPERDLVG